MLTVCIKMYCFSTYESMLSRSGFLIRARRIAFRLADLTPVAFERFQAGEIECSEGKEFGEVSRLKLVTAKKSPQLMIGDVRPQHEGGIVPLELFNRAVGLAPAVDCSQLVDEGFTEFRPFTAYE